MKWEHMFGFLFIVIAILAVQCKRDDIVPDFNTKHTDTSSQSTCKVPAERLIIVIIDGPRYKETGGDSTHALQPKLYDSLKSRGVLWENFYNNGITNTINGHISILNGVTETLSNNGYNLASKPGLLQLYSKRYPKAVCWLVASKDKVASVANSTHPLYKDKYQVFTDCGVSGLGSGHRDDSVTQELAMQKLKQHAHLLVVQYKEPDMAGHAGDWAKYLEGIIKTDEYAWELWQYTQTDTFYKDKTTFVITNDHGRHLDNIADGFVSHGDDCEGCRHINLFMTGPRIKSNYIVNTPYSQTDLNRTLLRLFELNESYSEGNVMHEALK